MNPLLPTEDLYREKGSTDEKGITLLELLTVIGIICITAAIVMPIFIGWLPRYRLKQAALDLFTNYQQARMLAIRNSGEYAMVFDPGANAYRLVSGGADGRYNGKSIPNDDVVEKTVHLSDYGSDVKFGHGDAWLNATSEPSEEFPADGVSYEDKSAEFNAEGISHKMGYVYLTNSSRTAYALATPTMAGIVRICMWTGKNWQ